MNYLPRTIQPVIEEASKFFKIVMVSGMRQKYIIETVVVR